MENTIINIIFITGYGIAILFILETTALILSVVYALSVSAFRYIINKLMKEYSIIYFDTSVGDVVMSETRLFAISKSDSVRRFRINHGYLFKVEEVERVG